VSDDRVVSLTSRRTEPKPPLGACLVFANDRLRMPMEMRAPSPVWTVSPFVEAVPTGRDQPVPVYARFGMIEYSPHGTSGEVFENEHGITADLYFEREIFALLQGAALSAAPLTLFITFSAADGAPPTLMLSVERRTD
jgi:hypothetical protein